MGTHGTMGEFNSENETWTCYSERLEQYFIANGVESEDKKRAILLTMSGPATYQLIRNLCAPTKPTQKSFDQLVKVVRDHYEPPPPVMQQRFSFHSRSRQPGESIMEFVTDLKKLSEHCEFGDSLNDMLRDRLMCGVNNDRVQRSLLNESSMLTFEKAFNIAQALEASDHDVKELQTSSTASQNIHKGNTDLECSLNNCCKGNNYSSKECHFQRIQHKRMGHVDRIKARMDIKTTLASGKATINETKDGAIPAEYSLSYISHNSIAPFLIKVQLDGKTLCMEMNTGTFVSLISEETYHHLWTIKEAPSLQENDICLRTYTGEKIGILGDILVEVSYQDCSKSLNLFIVSGAGPSLFGRSWIIHFPSTLDILKTDILVQQNPSQRLSSQSHQDITSKSHCQPLDKGQSILSDETILTRTKGLVGPENTGQLDLEESESVL